MKKAKEGEVKCEPIWYTSKKVPFVSCKLCLASRRGCEFKDVDFGIGRWPTIVPCAESIARRAAGAASKRKGTPQVSKEDVPVAGTQGSISTSTTRTRKPAKPRGAPIESLTAPGPSTTSPATATGLSTTLVVPVAGPSSAPAEGRIHGVYLEPLEPFVAAASDLNLDGLTLSNYIINLQAIRRREEGDSFFISSLLRERRSFIEKLTRRLHRRVRDLGADTTEAESSSGSEDDDMDWEEGDKVDDEVEGEEGSEEDA